VKQAPALPVLLAAILGTAPAHAKDLCRQEFKWTDATYAKRDTRKDGQVTLAEVEVFANATVVRLNIDGARSGVIDLRRTANATSIQLTYGNNKPAPLEFAEISMIVEPPMARGNWTRLTGPCSIPDGTAVTFDENDIPASERIGAYPPKFRGTLQRHGLRVRYSMTSDDGEVWQGELAYGRRLKDLDPNADVSGWNVFRAGSYVETLPANTPAPLRVALERISGRPGLPPAR